MKLTAKLALGFFHVWVGSPGAKLVRVMKLTTIIILAACLQTSANGLAQNTVTFSGKDVNLESVFTAIKKQTSYRFFFNTSIIQNASKITIEVKNAPIEQVMNLALKDQSLTFAIKGRTIFIMKKPEEVKSSGQVAPPTGEPVTVRGTVTDEQGNPLAGANVKVKGTNIGVTTDGQGRFTLANVDENGILEISFVGHETQLLSVKGKNVFMVALGQKVGTLDETIVIAYGTTTRRFSTGNVSSVKASEIEKQPVNNPLLALQGRVPGLLVTQSTGLAGSGIGIKIQGQNSINNLVGNDPLYIIDGVPYTGQLLYTLTRIQGSGNNSPTLNGTNAGAGNPLSFINPLDIESIEVLKDADATAIYGSRAANGAILITTKRGKTGQTKVDFNIQNGWGKVTRKLKLLNTEQYLAIRHEGLRNDSLTPTNSSDFDLLVWDTTRYTDWQKELIGGTAQYTDLQASVSGGNSNTQFLIGSGYHRETTVFPGNLSDQKGSLHFSINNISSNKRFKLSLGGIYLVDNNSLIQRDLTQDAVVLSPIAPALYNSDGSLNWAPLANGNSSWNNPLAYLNNEYNNKTNNLVANASVGYQIFQDLELKSSFGYTNLQSNQILTFPLISTRPESRVNTTRKSQFANNNMRSWIIEPQLTYVHSFSNSKIDGLIGVTIQQENDNLQQLSGSGYNSDLVLQNIGSAPTVSTFSGVSVYKYNALFGRINYSFRNRYIINLTARRDGSSRFGSESQLHNFGAIGAAWIFSEEAFVKNNLSFLSFGKLRWSYGTTGNDQIGDYQFLNLYSNVSTSVAYQGATGLTPNGLTNPYLQWEETKKLQFGIEIGLLNDRVWTNATYYNNSSSNELLPYNLPIITGFTRITRNFPATVRNYGWEFTINAKNINNKNFSWTTNVNFTIPKNKLVKFPDLSSSSYATSLVVGQPITIIKVYKSLGVDPNTGLYIFDSKTDPNLPVYNDDANVLINTSPKFYGGIQNRVTYKGVSLDFLFQYVKQDGPTYFLGSLPGRFSSFSGSTGNQPAFVLDRWQNAGDNKPVQQYSATYNTLVDDTYSRAGSSNLAYSDASYIRLKNLALSVDLPSSIVRKLHLLESRLFVQGQNLITITNYKGLDPETRSSTTLPPLKVVTIGIRVVL